MEGENPMQSRMILLVSAVAVSGLCGCAKINEDLGQIGYGVAAEPLYATDAQGNVSVPSVAVSVSGLPTATNKDKAWGYVVLSEAKCTKFLNGIVAAETGSNTLLDMESTLFSALSTAFSPASTKTALSAVATITGGWKTAIDSDVFAKASIANFAQAISSSYFKDMGTYGTALENKTDDNSIDPAAEFAKIQTIHAECALAPAQATISTTLTAGANAPSGTNGSGGGTANVAGASGTGTTSQTTGFVTPGHPVQPGPAGAQ